MLFVDKLHADINGNKIEIRRFFNHVRLLIDNVVVASAKVADKKLILTHRFISKDGKEQNIELIAKDTFYKVYCKVFADGEELQLKHCRISELFTSAKLIALSVLFTLFSIFYLNLITFIIFYDALSPAICGR